MSYFFGFFFLLLLAIIIERSQYVVEDSRFVLAKSIPQFIPSRSTSSVQLDSILYNCNLNMVIKSFCQTVALGLTFLRKGGCFSNGDVLINPIDILPSVLGFQLRMSPTLGVPRYPRHVHEMQRKYRLCISNHPGRPLQNGIKIRW